MRARLPTTLPVATGKRGIRTRPSTAGSARGLVAGVGASAWLNTHFQKPVPRISWNGSKRAASQSTSLTACEGALCESEQDPSVVAAATEW